VQTLRSVYPLTAANAALSVRLRGIAPTLDAYEADVCVRLKVVSHQLLLILHSGACLLMHCALICCCCACFRYDYQMQPAVQSTTEDCHGTMDEHSIHYLDH
jgi:hypothetical protein